MLCCVVGGWRYGGDGGKTKVMRGGNGEIEVCAGGCNVWWISFRFFFLSCIEQERECLCGDYVKEYMKEIHEAVVMRR